MPFFDRFWWLRLLGALALVAFFGGFAALILWMQVSSWFPPGMAVVIDLMTAMLAILGAGFVIAVVVLAVRARRRHRMRRHALAGEPDAVPLARLTANAGSAPDVTAQPLEVMWRPTALTRAKPLFASGCLLFLLCPIAFTLAYVLRDAPSVRPPALGAAGLASLICAGVFIVGTVKSVRAVVFGDRFGVTASSEGIVQRTRRGRLRLLRWEDARLLEVAPMPFATTGQAYSTSSSPSAQSAATRNDASGRLYVLYGTRGSVRWIVDTPELRLSSAGNRTYEPNGIDDAEMARRQQALLDLIAARAGLVPRTFARQLRPSADLSAEQAAHMAGRISLFAGAVALCIVGMFCLAFGAAILLLPATTWLPLNLVSALGLTVIGGALLALALRGKELALGWLKREATAVPRESEIETKAGSSLVRDDVSAVYALAYGIPPTIVWLAHWIAFLFLAVALPALLLPVELLAIVLPSGAFPAAAPQLAGGVGVALALVVAPIGLLGVALLLLLRRLPREWTRFEVRADAQGLTMTFAGKHSTALLWSAVRALRVVSLDGMAVGYGVMDKEPESASTVGMEGEVEAGSTEEKQQENSMAPETDNKDRGEGVLWPAGFARWRQDIEGATPISPAELAALVERRSGVKLVAENHDVGIFAPRTRGS